MQRTFAPWLGMALVAGLVSSACGAGAGLSRELHSAKGTPGPTEYGGTLDVLTYNVAGLPALLSPSNPDVNSRQVSPHLNRYDIVLAQEDFSYHDELVHAATHPFQLGPQEFGGGFVGDGLTTLSTYPVVHERRQTWRRCNGYLFSLNDCLGEKGFSVASVDLGGGRAVHVYNLHADAGSDAADVGARAEGFAQLADFIAAHSKGAALIVGGDTNLDPAHPTDRATLREFLRRTKLRDTCEDSSCARSPIDRILFRSSARVQLRAEMCRADPAFVDNFGRALSDHPALAVRFFWTVPDVYREGLPRAVNAVTLAHAAGHAARRHVQFARE